MRGHIFESVSNNHHVQCHFKLIDSVIRNVHSCYHFRITLCVCVAHGATASGHSFVLEV